MPVMKIEETFSERIKKYAREGRRHFEEGDLDLASFFVEQSLQLALKLVLLKRTGAFPYTHNLHLLFKELLTFRPDLAPLYSQNRALVDDIYQAYFSSRYYPFEFDRETVGQMVTFLEQVLELLKDEIG